MLINMIPYVQVDKAKVRQVGRYADKLARRQKRLEKDRQVSRQIHIQAGKRIAR